MTQKKYSHSSYKFYKQTLILLGVLALMISSSMQLIATTSEENVLSKDTLGAKWSKVNTNAMPLEMEHQEFVYDTKRDQLLMITGSNGVELNEMWQYNSGMNTWSKIKTFRQPMILGNFAAWYDTSVDAIFLFGGLVDGNPSAQLFRLEMNEYVWSEVNVWVKPDISTIYSVVYDMKNEVAILFGGSHDGRYYDKTWQFDAKVNTWTEINTSTQPSARIGHIMTYNSALESILLVGGYDQNNVFIDETWEFNYQTSEWILRNSDNGHHNFEIQDMQYISKRDTVISLGSFSDESNENKVGIFSFDYANNLWMELAHDETPSGSITEQKIGYDEANDVLILFTASTFSQDDAIIWELKLIFQETWENEGRTLSVSDSPDDQRIKLFKILLTISLVMISLTGLGVKYNKYHRITSIV